MKQELCRRLGKTAVVGSDIQYFDVIDSTNAYLREAALAGTKNGAVVIAGHQIAGRGRLGRVFESPEGKGLYLSVLLRPQLPLEKLLPVTALAGVAACRAIERVCGAQPELKWPNDLVLNGKKLAGILTELVMGEASPCVVLGIGINVSQEPSDFTSEVAEIATSLKAELGEVVPQSILAAVLIEELDALYTALCEWNFGEYLTEYRRRCVNLGKTVRLTEADGQKTALAVDIDETFGLVIRDHAGMRTLRSGEVSVRGLYGYTASEDDGVIV